METSTQPPPQQFCVRWNSYQSNLQNAFPKLLTSEHFVDVTLACENEMLKCHKVVLSACSTYFEKLLLDNPCQHPIVFMKDMKFHEMQSLVEFMYKGEVNVTQDDLPSLLKSAEALQIRGLCGSDQLLSQQALNNLKGIAKTTNGSALPDGKSSLVKPSLANESLAAKLQQLQQHLSQQTAQPITKINHHHQQKEQVTDATNKDSGAGVKKEEKTEACSAEVNASSSECDSNDALVIKEDADIKDEFEDSFYDADGDLMDTEFAEGEDTLVNTARTDKSLDFAIANVSCQYDGSPGSTSRRVRRSDEELRRAAECITRGQTFQMVSDQFNIPISTIRFYMARKGILPRRKRGRACSGTSSSMSPNNMSSSSAYSSSMVATSSSGNSFSAPGNTSPIGPPYHIVHYKLPQLGVSKLK